MKYLRLFILLTTLALSRPSLAQLQKQAQLSRFFDALNSGRFSELGQIYAPTDSVAPSVKLAIQAFTEVGKNRYDLAIDVKTLGLIGDCMVMKHCRFQTF
mgnify:CR=1 FL=1